MFKKCLSLLLAFLLLHVSVGPVFAKSKAEKKTQFATKVKANILKLGMGETALMKLKLRDKTKLEGYISEAGAESFVVTDAKDGVATTVAYTQVVSIVTVPESSGAVMAESVPAMKEIQRQVERAGVGSYVALKLTDGKSLGGRIEEIEERYFTVGLLQEGAQLQVNYEQVAKLKVTKKTSYRAKGQPNASLARQAIEGLGVDTHVMVKLPGERILRGHIQAIDEKNFTLRLDASGQPTLISYDQVLQVRHNPHVPIIIAVVATIGALVALVVYLATRKTEPSPFVSNINPNTVQAGKSVDVKITGNNFAAGAIVTFKGGIGPAPTASNVVVVDANTITATVTVNSGGPSRNRVWDVAVANNKGRGGQLKDGFTVTP